MTRRPTRNALVLALLAALAALPVLAEEEAEKEEWKVSEPPGEWRTVVIDTTETTWSNVDVSPDGSTILFDMLGDVFTVPIEGGEATAVTDGIEWNYQPTYSPDGTEIVFVSDRAGADNLWVMKVDGSEPRAVTSEKANLVHTTPRGARTARTSLPRSPSCRLARSPPGRSGCSTPATKAAGCS